MPSLSVYLRLYFQPLPSDSIIRPYLVLYHHLIPQPNTVSASTEADKASSYFTVKMVGVCSQAIAKSFINT